VCVKEVLPHTFMVIDDITVKGKVLEPLADLCGSTRRDLLKSLREILEDRDALALLGETLDRVTHGEYERPQTEVVASFMDQLDVSKVSKHLIEAVDLLISALDGKYHLVRKIT
ncbi:hypothetical protein XENORESO_019313, partial [Xenotaenia resolanae]